MIVGQFNDSFPPIIDGVAMVTRQYALQMSRLLGGPESSYVVTSAYPDYRDTEDEFQIIRYISMPLAVRPPYRFGLPNLDLKLRRRLQEIPFDLVHAHCPFSSGQLALKIARERCIPLITSFHSKYFDDFLRIVRSEAVARAMLWTIMRFYDKADVVWTVSRGSVDTLREYGYTGPVDVVLNGTDLPPSQPENRRSPAAEAIAKRLGLAAGMPIFLFVGQHVWQKNTRLLLDALAVFKKRYERPFRMVFVGSGEAADDMQKLAELLGLADETVFAGPIVDRNEMRGIYERADLLLFPSLYDTSALVVREAASALCPAALVDGSIIADGIEDGVNGYLSANNPEAFAETIARAMSDDAARQAAGLAAQQSLQRGWDEVGTEVLEKYRRIIAEHKNDKVSEDS